MHALKSALLDVFRLAWPYFNLREKGTVEAGPLRFSAQERVIGIGLFAAIVLINLAQVGISVRLSYWNRDWFDTIQNRNGAEFWRLLLTVWVFWVIILIVSNVVEFLLTSALKIRWRTWMTRSLTERWLSNETHYRLQFIADGVDNPDQRIQEDANKFIGLTLQLSIGIINQVSSLASFTVILWGLSSALTIPGTETQIPGLLVWAAFIYASLGTVAAHLIGRRLIALNFEQERYEANFRYSLARLREYAEPIALLRGEEAEKAHLSRRFGDVITNFYAIVAKQKYLTAFQQFYGSSASVVPYIIIAPFYFLEKISLGVMTQTAGAFARVEGAFAFFIFAYTTVAEYKAVVDRLTGFGRAMDATRTLGETPPHIAIAAAPREDIAIEGLSLRLPNGRVIVSPHDLSFRPGETVLITGRSGSGKSTLLRALAGIWPFGEGTITVPAGASVMLLPQRPYLPIGTLRQAVTYPALPGSFDDDALKRALELAKLPHLVDRLDEARSWSQALSMGEQQRVAIARALLARPDWLFLDEATAALDEPLEAEIYAALKRELQHATLISIGHRSTLHDMHERRIDMSQRGDVYTPREVDHAGAPAAAPSRVEPA